MKGDVIVLEPHHKIAGEKIASYIIPKINNIERTFIVSVSGESGSGKSETAKAIQDELAGAQIKSIILAQDDYFVLPPKSNDKRRREDDTWLGPHVEVDLGLLSQHIQEALDGAAAIKKPLIDYQDNSISYESISLDGVQTVIVEGTYTALIRKIDCRVFIERNWADTLEHRKKRNRGNEVNDPFIEGILKTEHKIIAGHRFLADILISRDYQVSLVK